jgi:hypothetical protein
MVFDWSFVKLRLNSSLSVDELIIERILLQDIFYAFAGQRKIFDAFICHNPDHCIHRNSSFINDRYTDQDHTGGLSVQIFGWVAT